MSGFSDDIATTKQSGDDPTIDQKPTTDDDVNYLEQFVGEGKKYQSVEDAAKGLAKKASHADKFIEDLKKEKAEMEERLRDQQTRAKTADEILEALRNQPDPVKDEEQPKPKEQPNNQMSEEQMQKMWEQWATQKEAAREKQTRVTEAWSKLASEDVFGDMEKAKVAVSGYIGKSAERKALVDQMAISDPDGLITLLKMKNGKQDVNFMDGVKNNQNSDEFTAPSTNLTWDIVRQVKKEHPDVYKSTAFKQRMHKELPKE